ncbi:MAG TPA: FAD-dependent oxidoreductase, partial [Opitutales bacterium]|nr:FAD-dependent oxidoreductase [Opitutales bacterium]
TSGGVTAAIQAAKMGKTVAIVNHYPHLGGLTSAGLGRTDTGRSSSIGGLSREFYQRVRTYYEQEEVWHQETREDYLARSPRLLPAEDDAQWGFEPHVAEAIFYEMIGEHDIAYRPDEFLIRDEGRGVIKDGNRIVELLTESGNRYRGKMFIDATYEGDLLEEAGVSFIIGREGNDAYDETLNGIQTVQTRNHVFTHEGEWVQPKPLPVEARVDPYVIPGDPESGLLAGVNPDAGGENGEGDDRVQSYCYRLCLTDVPENQIAFTPPPGYDEADFELLFRMFEAGEKRIPWLPGPMPNRKTDTNNRWAVSTNLIGGSHEYPAASYEKRREIEKAHEYWQRGLMYSLANHPRVPEHVREEVSRWGYAADEFVDNNNWPYAIYVRVGRRMVSDYVMTEHDCRGDRTAPDPVGMGSYGMDSHNVQRYVTPEGYVQNEGNIEVGLSAPYVISYRSIIPKRGEVENLLVPVAVSSSHIAFGSIRMEPVFMILGQSAATAAVQAIEDEVSVQDVDYEKLRARLIEDGQLL